MEIKVPNNFKPRHYQRKLLSAMDNGAERAVIVWHRRAGKDKTCFNYMISRAFREKGTYYYFMPTGTQSKKAIWDNIDNDGFKMLNHIPDDVKKENSQEMKIELVNGSIIQLIASDKFEKRAVGTNPRGVVFSEYSITEPQVWDFVRPILAFNDGWAIFNFTPRGTNHAYKILNIARRNKWFNEILTIEDTQGKERAKEIVDKEREEGMPEDLIEQEYYCKFLEGASQFFRKIDNCCIAETKKPDPTHRYQIGVDLAKHQDFTVISVFDLTTFRQVEIERFSKIDYNLQKSKIEAISYRYGNPDIYIDSTGVGEPIYDDLEQRGLNVLPFKFNTRTKKELLDNLRIKLEKEEIYLLNNELLKDELRSFRYELTDRGKTRIDVPSGVHDDIVDATALSVLNLPVYRVKPKGLSSHRFLDRGGQENNNIKAETYE